MPKSRSERGGEESWLRLRREVCSRDSWFGVLGIPPPPVSRTGRGMYPFCVSGDDCRRHERVRQDPWFPLSSTSPQTRRAKSLESLRRAPSLRTHRYYVSPTYLEGRRGRRRDEGGVVREGEPQRTGRRPVGSRRLLKD